jgi:hypothetical protein
MIQACVVYRKNPQFGKVMLCQAHHRESSVKAKLLQIRVVASVYTSLAWPVHQQQQHAYDYVVLGT